jgi:outer membrane protein assembly factor BamA
VLIPYLSLVYDNTRFGPTGPIDGVRYNISYGKSIGISSDAVRFDVLVGDARKYFMLGNRHSFAVRLVGAHTRGRDAEPFWIGGSENLRGFEDYSLTGDYVGFLNLELRTPFIDQFKLAFPLPLEIRYLRGALFVDLGAACNSPEELVLMERGSSGYRLRDLKMGFGAGIRLPMSFFILKLDFAKNTDFENISKKTYVHFSLGSDF